MARQTVMQRLMQELVICGGQLWTRQGLYNELLHTTYSDPDLARRCADYTAFGSRTLPATEAEIAARAGTTLDCRTVKEKQAAVVGLNRKKVSR